MAKRGKRVRFHGAFATKAAARKKERRRKGAYIRRVRMKGRGVRYLVLTRI